MRSALFLFAASLPALASAQNAPIDGIDFADQPGTLYVPLHAAAANLGWSANTVKRKLIVNGHTMLRVRTLLDGTKLIPVKDMSTAGATVTWDPVVQQAKVDVKGKTILVKRGAKYAVVNKRVQELRAYQGGMLVLKTHVSTGRKGHGTPNGDFVASRKERLHLSSLYDDSPMPWAVQINGNIFVHGFTSVPRTPASHGCVRVPVWGSNPARWFYSWVSLGTPVTVANEWPEERAASNTHSASTGKAQLAGLKK